MGYIYKIYNDINNKIYIGQTSYTLENRFSKHKTRLKEYNEKQLLTSPLYNAMNKYGIEHFYIESIEECRNNQLLEKEIYWIDYYDTYNNGYNGTRGGEGVQKYDYEQIYEILIEHPELTCQQIARQFNCCAQVVSNVAHINNIDLKQRVSNQKKGFKTKYHLSVQKIVNQYDLNNNFIQQFNSIKEAARYLVTQNICKSFDSARASISKVCNHPDKFKTAYNFIWKFN